MTIKRAVNHFIWKFKKVWKPTEPDVNALNEIIKFVEEKHAKQLENNQLFAKLYISYYGLLLKKHNETIFDKKAQIELHQILETPLEQLIEIFTDNINQDVLYYKLKSDIKCPIAEDFRHVHETRIADLFDSSVSEKTKIKKIIEFKKFKAEVKEELNKKIEQNPEFFIEDQLEYEETKDNLTSLINLALNEYR